MLLGASTQRAEENIPVSSQGMWVFQGQTGSGRGPGSSFRFLDDPHSVLRKLRGGASSPWRRVQMALISTHFRSSSATLASASARLSLSIHLHSENGPSEGTSRPRPGPPCFPAGLLSCSLPGHLPHPFRTPSSQQLTVFYQHKPRAFGLAHSPSLVGPG